MFPTRAVWSNMVNKNITQTEEEGNSISLYYYKKTQSRKSYYLDHLDKKMGFLNLSRELLLLVFS